MTLLISLFSVAAGLVVFVPNIYIKGFGLFFQGIFHVKITLSYTYMFELVPDESKGFCGTRHPWTLPVDSSDALGQKKLEGDPPGPRTGQGP